MENLSPYKVKTLQLWNVLVFTLELSFSMLKANFMWNHLIIEILTFYGTTKRYSYQLILAKIQESFELVDAIEYLMDFYPS